MPQDGEKAPDFELPTEDGKALKLAKLKGKPVVLYFYPKDDTSGCTREAQDFTALAAEFEKAGTWVLGVSKDEPAKHRKFIDKYDLKVALASDADGTACETFGTWVEKRLYGRNYMGIERATFLIDRDGRIDRIWRKVKVAGHAAAVLEAAKELA